MDALLIPLSISSPQHDLVVELDGRDWLLDLVYNPRGEFWAMDIKDMAGNIRAAGQKLAGNGQMLRLFDSPDLPQGQFYVFDAGSNEGRDPAFDTLGVDLQLWYREAASV